MDTLQMKKQSWLEQASRKSCNRLFSIEGGIETDKNELLIKFEQLEEGDIELTRREVRNIVIALKLLDAYDNALSVALDIV